MQNRINIYCNVMKNYIYTSLLSLLTISCTDSSENKLHDVVAENKELQSRIEVLKDSLSNFEEDFLHSQMLVGIADEAILRVGKENNVVMLFQTYEKKLPEYEIYKIEGNKEIRVGNNSNTRFNINFTPKSIEDNKLKILVKMSYKNKPIVLQSDLYFDVKQ